MTEGCKPMQSKLLEIRDLKTHFFTDGGVVRAVDGVSFDILRQSSMGLVGESGCGKSVTARSILRIVPPPGKIAGGQIRYFPKDDGEALELTQLAPTGREIRAIRGKVVAMIFQEPMTCLSPVHTIGNQIMESIRQHERGIGRREARERTIHLLGEVGMPRPERQIDAFTFELSGGMRQRAMIAVALAAEPELLIADEPTTAVDVTIQAKIMDLLRKLQAETRMSLFFITHNLGIIAEMARQVAVMYLGRIVEQGTVPDVFDRPKHPYTQVLLDCVPRLSFAPKSFLATIRGSVPGPFAQPPGCPFSNRCPRFMAGVCDQAMPALRQVEPDHLAACYLYSQERE
jgi:oligopeptide/dipeptide ABC transporter ATP-binding protein